MRSQQTDHLASNDRHPGTVMGWKYRGDLGEVT